MMENNEQNTALQEAFDKLAEQGIGFAEQLLKVDNGSSMIHLASLVQEGTSKFRGSVVGDPSDLAEMLSKAMEKDKNLASIIMAAASRFVRPKIEQMVNSDMIPQMLESLLENAGECDCPKCRKRKQSYN